MSKLLKGANFFDFEDGADVPPYLLAVLRDAREKRNVDVVLSRIPSFTKPAGYAAPNQANDAVAARHGGVFAQGRRCMVEFPFDLQITKRPMFASNSSHKICALCGSSPAKNLQGPHYHPDCPKYDKSSIASLRTAIINCLDQPANINAITSAGLQRDELVDAVNFCFK